jgi:hypothetical protein
LLITPITFISDPLSSKGAKYGRYRDPENKAQTMSLFQDLKKWMFKPHVHHTNHHVLTTKKPRPNTHFSQKTRKNHTPATNNFFPSTKNYGRTWEGPAVE